MNIGPFEWYETGANGEWEIQSDIFSDYYRTFQSEDALLAWLREGLEEALAAVEGGAK